MQKHIKLFLLLFLVRIAAAQLPHPAFHHYTTTNGLPSSECYDLLQDRRGYIWISTDNGISRFDGYQFENFGPEEGLANNVVFHMQEDVNGNIWMSTLSGNLFYYSYLNDRIYPFKHNAIMQRFKSDYSIMNGFIIDDEGIMYIALSSLGVLKISPNGEYNLIGEAQNCFNLVFIKDQDKVLFSRTACTIDARDISYKSDQFNLTIYNKNETKDFRIDHFQLYQLSQAVSINQQDIFFFWASYLFYFSDNNLQFSKKIPYRVNCIYHDDSGNIYLGLNERGGFIHYKSKEDLLNDKRAGHYFKDYSISHILKDKEGGLWLSTLENGIFYAPNPELQVFDNSSGISGNHITALSVKSNETVFFGLKNGDTYSLQPRTQKLFQFPKKKEDIEIYALYFDPNSQQLYKSSLDLDVWENGKWKKFNLFSSGLEVKSGGRKIVPANAPDNLWVVRLGSSGIGQISTSINKYVYHPGSNHSLRFRIFDVYEDYSNRVWLGRLDGLHRLNLQDSIIYPVRPHPDLHTRVEDIHQLEDSSLVIGTKGRGIIIWKGDDFLQISSKEGLTSSMIENIHVDEANFIWIGTLNGLNRLKFNPDKSYSIKTYTVANGLPSNEINAMDSYEDTLWVATTNGLAKLPISEGLNLNSPKPIISRLQVNGEVISPDSIIFLSHNQNDLLIQLLTINYKLNGKISYRFRLNKNHNWEYIQNPIINLAALSPGIYQLEVQSENEDGKWSASTRLDFEIALPYWQTWGFIFGLSLCLLSILYLLYNYRVKQLQKEAKFQQEKVERELERSAMEKELRNLEAAAMRAQMNPHFVSNCLNSIQSFITQGDDVSAMRYLSDFNQLLRKTLDISINPLVPLEEDIKLLEHYLKLEQMRFNHKFEYQLIQDASLNDYAPQIPPMLVQPFVENAILHAFPKSIEHPKIEVRYLLQDRTLCVMVKDNGIGINQSKAKKKKQRKSLVRSFGIELPKKRLKLAGKTQNQVIIEELKNKQGQIYGTQVLIFIELE